MADPTRRIVDLLPFRTDAVYNLAYGAPANVYALVIMAPDMEVEDATEITLKGGIRSWWELRQEQRFYLSMYGSDAVPYSRGYAADDETGSTE